MSYVPQALFPWGRHQGKRVAPPQGKVATPQGKRQPTQVSKRCQKCHKSEYHQHHLNKHIKIQYIRHHYFSGVQSL